MLVSLCVLGICVGNVGCGVNSGSREGKSPYTVPGSGGYTPPAGTDPGSGTTPGTGSGVSEGDTGIILEEINDYRAQKGLPALVYDPAIAAVSQAYADWHMDGNHFRYGNPGDGRTPADRLTEGGVSFSICDEIGGSSENNDYILTHFLTYCKDTAPLDNPDFKRIGIGIASWSYDWAG
jgi:uncharacterized protein YkwD